MRDYTDEELKELANTSVDVDGGSCIRNLAAALLVERRALTACVREGSSCPDGASCFAACCEECWRDTIRRELVAEGVLRDESDAR